MHKALGSMPTTAEIYMVAHASNRKLLGSGGRKLRNSRLSSATQGGCGQPRFQEILSETQTNQNRHVEAALGCGDFLDTSLSWTRSDNKLSANWNSALAALGEAPGGFGVWLGQ